MATREANLGKIKIYEVTSCFINKVGFPGRNSKPDLEKLKWRNGKHYMAKKYWLNMMTKIKMSSYTWFIMKYMKKLHEVKTTVLLVVKWNLTEFTLTPFPVDSPVRASLALYCVSFSDTFWIMNNFLLFAKWRPM